MYCKKVAEENRWDNYFMRIAILAALRSKDPSTPVSYTTVALHVYMYI